MFTLLAKTKKCNFHLHLFPRDTSNERFWPISADLYHSNLR